VNESGVMNVTMMDECGAVRMNMMVICVEEWGKDGIMEECNPGNLEGGSKSPMDERGSNDQFQQNRNETHTS